MDVFAGAVEARAHLAAIAATLGLPFEEQRGIPYVWRHRRSETEFPTREEFWTIAPAIVESKARGGLAWFDAKWSDEQMDLSNPKLLDGRAVRDGNPVNRRTEAPVLQEAGHAEWIGGCKRV